MFEVDTYDVASQNFSFGRGGNQGARGNNNGGDYFVENVRPLIHCFFWVFCGDREVNINMGCVNAHTLLAASFPPSGVYTISAVQVMEELVRCLTWPPVDPLARCGDLVIDSHSCALVVWSSRLVGLPWRVLCRPQGRCALSEL